MTNLLMGILVLFSSADGKLAERTAHDTASYLDRLYQTSSRCVADGTPGAAKVCVVLGQACDALASNLPPLAPDELQVRVRKEQDRQEILLRGGSPFATRAAAMRFLEQCGVLFGPLQDFLPDQQALPAFAPLEIRERPRCRLFGPHYWLNFPMDPSSFTREEWMRLVLGWSRMRATVMGYHFYQSFPWYDVEMRGFKDQSGYFFYSQRHPLAPQPELRYAVHNERTFVSRDVEPFAEDIPQLHAWAQATVRRAMALAHELGLKNSVTFEPFGYGVPQPYLAKMKEWNSGAPVDPKDRLHPLMREYVLSAIRSILQTYPDLDILKLVSGEGAQRSGTPAELRAHIRELIRGDAKDPQGRPIELPDGEALAILADTLTSCKLANEAVAEARNAGVLRGGLELAIGSYPGSNLKVHPALFALIGRVVTDPTIKLHFLPAHGMDLSATAMALSPAGVFSGRKLEISGWTEFDGNMYLPQSCLQAIDRMNHTLDALPVEALYAIQWRVAATTFNNAYFTRSQWDPALTPQKFWNDLTPLFGSEGAVLMRDGMEKLETVKPVENNFGFCYYGCWTPLLAAERADKQPPQFGRSESIDRRKQVLAEARRLVDQAGSEAASQDGRRLAEYFANKLACAEVHMDYWQEVAAAARDGAAAGERARGAVVPHALRMLNHARNYLRTYQQCMLDRTDEGMLASYWVVAGQYAYRYAYPELYHSSWQFYGGPTKVAEPSSAAPIQAPR